MGLPLRVSVLQIADRRVFAPICFLLTLLRRILPEPSADRPVRPRSIVFVKLAEQGSTVLALEALQAAAERVGRENLYFAAFQENRFIVDVLDIVPKENVLTVPTTSLAAMAWGTIRLLVRLRALRVEAAIDLEFLARFSAAITYLSGAPSRIGMHCFFKEGPYRGDLMTHRVLFNPHLHTSDMFRAMVEALDVPASSFPTFPMRFPAPARNARAFRPESAEIEEVGKIISSSTGLERVPEIILLNPNASDFLPLRRWPTARYGEVARMLLERFPEVWIAFTGLPEEAPASLALVRDIGSPRCFSLAGRTTLRQLLVLYNLARVLVTNDSGPAHFAALTAIQVVTLFGPESPRLFAARSPRTRVLYAGVACSPCINAFNNRQSSCRNNLCMQEISVREVFEAVCSALEASRQPGRAP